MTAASFQGRPSPPPIGPWRLNALLFALTTLSVFGAGAIYTATTTERWLLYPKGWESYTEAWQMAVPLLGILLFHEFGHWFAARAHGVPASLPYFLPLPISLLGTLGAVISMPERIRSRNALLDIGAAGPLAGMVVALPAMFVGVALSPVLPVPEHGQQEGQSLLYWAVKTLVHGPIPPGHDLFMHPTALAAWGGFLITSINLFPWGQLDGGHIAYALFGQRQDKYGVYFRRGLLFLFLCNAVYFLGPHVLGTATAPLEVSLGNTSFWLIWYGFTGLLGRFTGHEHPPCGPGDLSPRRRVVAWGCLVLFVLLFMPTPMAFY